MWRRVGALIAEPVADPLARLSLLVTFLTTLGVFLIVPNIAAFVQYNRGYPREQLGLLYFVGGCCSFVAMKATGSLVDRFGATPLVVVGSALHVFALWVGFIHPSASFGVMVFFVAYMLSGSVRMVPNGSLSTRVPAPTQRARFMSAQSAVQHTGSALGAMGSSVVLQTLPNGALACMPVIAWVALGLAVCIPGLVARLEGGVRRRELVRAEG
jgi:predicted MFS family arabinose efflux permease